MKLAPVLGVLLAPPAAVIAVMGVAWVSSGDRPPDVPQKPFLARVLSWKCDGRAGVSEVVVAASGQRVTTSSWNNVAVCGTGI